MYVKYTAFSFREYLKQGTIPCTPMKQPMLKPTLVLATIIYLLTLLPAILLAPFAGFLFDEGVADTLTYVFAGLWFVLPATLLVAVLGAWLAYAYSKLRLMTLLLSLPIIHAVLIVLAGILHFAR
jgi:hypothetical protein